MIQQAGESSGAGGAWSCSRNVPVGKVLLKCGQKEDDLPSEVVMLAIIMKLTYYKICISKETEEINMRTKK